MRDGKRESIAAERMISAVGVVGNVDGLGLEAVGVKLEKGLIVADGLGRTSSPASTPSATSPVRPCSRTRPSTRASSASRPSRGSNRIRSTSCACPAAPTAARRSPPSGLTEARAKAAGRELRIGRFPFRANGKALALGERDGLVKTIFDAKTGELIGAHMIGAEVTELIQGFVIAMQLEATEEDLMRTVFPHPTLSEMMGESALAAYGRALHIPPSGATAGRSSG